MPRDRCANLAENAIRAEVIYHNKRCAQGKAEKRPTISITSIELQSHLRIFVHDEQGLSFCTHENLYRWWWVTVSRYRWKCHCHKSVVRVVHLSSALIELLFISRVDSCAAEWGILLTLRLPLLKRINHRLIVFTSTVWSLQTFKKRWKMTMAVNSLQHGRIQWHTSFMLDAILLDCLSALITHTHAHTHTHTHTDVYIYIY